MNEILDDVISGEKIYKNRAIWVGTFLGGPLVAGYLLSQNFKSLGQPEKIKFTWIITIIATIVIFGGAFMISDDNKIPNQLIPIIYTAIAFGFYKKFQERSATDHIDSGGLVYSWWRVVGVSIVGLLITSALAFALVFAFQPDEQSIYKTNTYGSLVKHKISFDKTNISEKEIHKIADGLKEAVFFDLSIPKYVHAEKAGNTYVLYIAVIKEIENDPITLKYFEGLREYIDDYFPNNSVEFRLVDDYIENVVKVLK
ncbi:MAG TPA: hypothetical protein VFD77_04155 [Brumimicrobium sp.]|nr:hypothetical protein [Brumimicrobium sp.]